MITCKCNKVTKDTWSDDQCWDCWRLANIKPIQVGAGFKDPEELRSRFPYIVKLGKYNSTMGAISSNAHMPSPANTSFVARELPCIYEGDIAQRCGTCDHRDDNSPRHRRWCNHPLPTIDRTVYDESDWCTRTEVDPKILSCSKCPDRRRNLLRGFPDPLHPSVSSTDEAAHIVAFKSMLVSYPDYPGDDGQIGIIWTVHNPKFFTMVAIAVRCLRKLGCKLPIEIWYRSSTGKLDKGDVDGYGVTFIDRDELAQKYNDSRLEFGNGNSGGWSVKSYAATHTKLAKFWLLDSDALFVADPTNIIPTTPFSYWIDLQNWKYGFTNWSKFGLEDMSEKVPQVQGGHLWVDKHKAWRLLCMVQQANEHSDYWYSHSNADQSIFRAALAYGACEYEIFDDLNSEEWYKSYYGIKNPSNQGAWINGAFVCCYNKVPLITHYCQSKFFPSDLPINKQVPGDRERLLEYVEIARDKIIASYT